MTFQELLDKSDQLAASALTTSDPTKRQKDLEEALKLVCQFLFASSRKLKVFVEETLEASGLSRMGTPLTLHDVAFTHPELEVFRDSHTFKELLELTAQLLRQQRVFSSRRVAEIIVEVQRAYDDVANETLTLDNLVEKFGLLRQFFCQPPGQGGLGLPQGLPDGGGGGDTETFSQMVCRYIQTLTSVASLIAQFFTGGPSNFEGSEPRSSIFQAPVSVRLLAVLLTSAFATRLNAENDIPPLPKEKESPEGTPETNNPQEKVLEEAEYA